jgi:hypothetical protein
MIGFRVQKRAKSFIDSAIEMEKERELSVGDIRPTFLSLTKRELPGKADNLRAIFQASREPRIFVRFETNSEGIKYILQEFGGERVISKTLNTDDLRAMKKTNRRLFNNSLSKWQNETGLDLFDQDAIESCRVLEYHGYRGYKVLIDDQKNTVYIFAYWGK